MAEKKTQTKRNKRLKALEESGSPLPMLHRGEVYSPKTMQFDNIRGVRQEMTRVYKLVFDGKIMLDEATRLTYILHQMIQAIRVESEIDALNQAYAKSWGGVNIILPGANNETQIKPFDGEVIEHE